jgi:hypothetical protein
MFVLLMDLPGDGFKDSGADEQGENEREQDSPAIERKAAFCGYGHRVLLQNTVCARKIAAVIQISGRSRRDQRQQQASVQRVADVKGNFMPADVVSQEAEKLSPFFSSFGDCSIRGSTPAPENPT